MKTFTPSFETVDRWTDIFLVIGALSAAGNGKLPCGGRSPGGTLAELGRRVKLA